MTSTPYPHIIRLGATTLASEEQLDGTPDFLFERRDGVWFVKWRTSAMWSKLGRMRAAQAVATLTEQLRRGDEIRQRMLAATPAVGCPTA